ncbi:MAG: hypothetical protein RDU30_18440, partial [Desulfovibrionaceae bacterium]|nr:hypothetical protein [Desulfovibrionaceae bacterium]
MLPDAAGLGVSDKARRQQRSATSRSRLALRKPVARPGHPAEAQKLQKTKEQDGVVKYIPCIFRACVNP